MNAYTYAAMPDDKDAADKNAKAFIGCFILKLEDTAMYANKIMKIAARM